MSDPFTATALSFIGMGGQALSTIMNVASGFRNASIARKEGDIAIDQSQLNAQQIQKQGNRATSTQFAAAGASGVVPTEGSPIDVILETQRETALRKADELYAGKIGKFNATQKANTLQMDAFGNFFSGIGKLGVM